MTWRSQSAIALAGTDDRATVLPRIRVYTAQSQSGIRLFIFESVISVTGRPPVMHALATR